MDTTSLGIIGAILTCGTYSSMRFWRQKALDVGTLFVMALAGFAIPTGYSLIRAGFIGDAGELPPDWRAYVAASGVVAIGLAVQYLLDMLKSSVTGQATVEAESAAAAADKKS